jgi:DNA invertase Pin-like site-specific DNA recombinase
MGYKIGGEYQDAGISGKRTDNRPGMQAALDHACREKAALVVYSLSRLGRSTKDVLVLSERLDKAGADLVSLSEEINTSSAAGRMVFRMLAVLSEFERDLVSERTSAALAHKRAQGYFTGGYCSEYGYDLTEDGHLIENAEEQAAISLMRDLRERGLSLRAIGAELEGRGITSKTGKKWSAQAIKKILDRVDREAA